jgi:ABC-type transporter Mla MlaB component
LDKEFAVQVQGSQIEIVPVKTGSFSHSEACRIADAALKFSAGRTIVIDLKNVADATTSAFARLVLLRRLLLKTGRDLRLANLRERAASLYQVNRLSTVLPCA